MRAMPPEQENLLVMKNSITGTRKTGVFAAIGISSALVLHLIYINLGIANSHPQATFILKAKIDILFDGKKYN